MSLGTNIKVIRKKLHLTQSDVAQKIGVSFETVSGWENDKYSPSMENLQALAQVLSTSVDKLLGEEITFVNVRLFSERNMSPFLKAKLSGEEWKMSAAALNIAKKYHEGAYRDRNHDVPYINHPLTLACQAFAMGVAEDSLVAALLLHDVVEDNREKIGFIDLPVDHETREAIRLVTKDKSNPDFSEDSYYEAIYKNPLACMIKCMDRCNNLSTMYTAFSPLKIKSYIRETERYILPLLRVVKDTPKWNNAAWILSYHMNSVINAYKRLL